MLDRQTIESQIRNYKVREGVVYKRSKFLQQWRERWVVITMNFIFTFNSRSCKELTDAIDFREIKALKSYLRKEEQMIPACFQVRTDQEKYYFCARNNFEKWSWVVTIERILDFKYSGKSPYNSLEAIKTEGFVSQQEFENMNIENKSATSLKTNNKSIDDKQNDEYKRVTLQLKELALKEQDFNKKEQSYLRKQRQDQQEKQQIMEELNKLKAESLRMTNMIKEQEVYELERKIQSEDQQCQEEQKVQGQQNLNVIDVMEKEQQVQPEQKVVAQQVLQQKKQSESINESNQNTDFQVSSDISSSIESDAPQRQRQKQKSRVSELAHMFQNLRQQSSNTPSLVFKKPITQKKIEPIARQMHTYRSKIVSNLFEELHSDCRQYEGIKNIIEFLVMMSANRNLGYQTFSIIESKAHKNKANFSDLLVEFIKGYQNVEKIKQICGFVEVILFQAPGLFKPNQIKIIKEKFKQFLLNQKGNNSSKEVLKAVFVIHKIAKYDKSQTLLCDKLRAVASKSQSEEVKSWAKKILDDF